MSKERLEEIAYKVGVSIDGEKAIMSSDDYDFLYNYALEQAERVQELEEFKRSAEQLYKNYHLSAKKSVAEKEELREQNKRYREALEFYADEENYCVTFEDDYEPILKDNGKIARQALGWEEEK